ncbi:MAG TPA: acyl-CoA dehydrogenase family protein [Peptococcaceae bacterium]|jgi:alkylation response protein AidB-like acyl-CoA dehydrogenase|nr:acyl-CoA dehydrogenase [Clostridia bacterium]HQD53707.1 acyl-CoA dehydrogenase family protein [Peptococcaceae bacterium]
MGFFQFTEEQEMLRKAVREFVEAEIAPHAAEWDEKHYCPVELFPKMGEMGITGIFVPEEYGGAGLGHVERAICLEEISRYSAGLGIALMTHHLGIAPILYFGTDEQKQKYLPDLAAGKKICGLSVTEPGGGSDFMGLKATGEFKDGQWVINGRKCFITNASVADVDIWAVVTGQDEKGRALMTVFIIDKDTPGHAPGREENKIGLNGSSTGDVICNDVVLGEEAVLGEVNKGAKIAISAIQEIGRAGMAAISVGILRGCLEEGVKFSNERILYGKPLNRLQAIQFIIAENRVAYEAAKLLTYHAASLKDAGKPCANEFSMAKLFATEAAIEAAKKTIDLMGGYGCINEYPVGRFLRDAIATIPAGGTSHIQKIIIAGNAIRGN